MDFDQYLASYGISRNDIGEDDLGTWYADWQRTQQQQPSLTASSTNPNPIAGPGATQLAPPGFTSSPSNPNPYTGPVPMDGPQNGDYRGYFQSLTNGRPPTPASLSALEPTLNKYNIHVLKNASGVAGKIQLPDGSVIDVIQGAGAGGQGWQWLGPGSGSSGGGGNFSIDPSYLAPFTESFNPGADAALPPGFNAPAFNAPGDFKMPTAEDVYADPSYKFRFGEGLKALDNGAAARGLINSGGTLTDEQQYGQQFASQEYNNIVGRNFNLWDADWKHALDAYKTNLGASEDTYNSAVNRSNEAYGRARQGFQDRKDIFYSNENNPFSKLYQVGSLGASAASA